MNKKIVTSALLLLACLPSMSSAQVRLITGPTPIQDGEARAAGDITVANQKMAFALALQSGVPYGVPRGAMVDVAPVTNGKIGRDRAVFADFIPNNWSAWPNTYQRVEIVERGPRQVVIKVERDWGKVNLSTRYTLKDNADRVEIETTMRNGGETALPDLLSGLVLWPKGGFMFGVPGLGTNGPVKEVLAERTVAYGEDWTLALHASYFNDVEYDSRDLYRRHTLQAGESRSFAGWLQVGGRGDLAPVIGAEIERRQLAAGKVSGVVRGVDGKPVSQPVVVVEKDGKPYGWVLGARGAYQLDLPAGEYQLYATAKGYSQTPKQLLKVADKATVKHNFTQLQGPGTIRFEVRDGDGKALDARIDIDQGQQPLVQFLGKKTFFTELDHKGLASLSLAPGDYRFKVSSGGTFLFDAAQLNVDLKSAASQTAKVELRRFADPAARGWVAADLHHHADQAEASTPPADLARAQLAAGLDLLFVSDHDTMVNLPRLQAIADRRGVPFIGSMEFSASWAHFNAYPLAAGRKLEIDMSTANIDQILAEARRLGASVVQLNHPFIPYGYLASVAAKVAPGGYNPGYDAVEINAATPGDDDKVLKAVWADWNKGVPHYLAGGTDVHDVWNEHSGAVRTFVHVDGKVTAASYAAALKAGRAYVSHGPLIVPDTVFGERLAVAAGNGFSLGFDLKSLAGIKRVELIADGVTQLSKNFDDLPRQRRLEFAQTAQASGWFALIVEDRDGRKAYTNPIWVDVK